MVKIGLGAYREQIDYKLTRYASYLIAQNGDSRKMNTWIFLAKLHIFILMYVKKYGIIALGSMKYR